MGPKSLVKIWSLTESEKRVQPFDLGALEGPQIGSPSLSKICVVIDFEKIKKWSTLNKKISVTKFLKMQFFFNF